MKDRTHHPDDCQNCSASLGDTPYMVRMTIGIRGIEQTAQHTHLCLECALLTFTNFGRVHPHAETFIGPNAKRKPHGPRVDDTLTQRELSLA